MAEKIYVVMLEKENIFILRSIVEIHLIQQRNTEKLATILTSEK